MHKTLPEILRVRISKKAKKELSDAAAKMRINGKRVTVSDLIRDAAEQYINARAAK